MIVAGVSPVVNTHILYKFYQVVLLSSITTSPDTQSSDSILKLSNLMGYSVSLHAKVAPSPAWHAMFASRIKDNKPSPTRSRRLQVAECAALWSMQSHWQMTRPKLSPALPSCILTWSAWGITRGSSKNDINSESSAMPKLSTECRFCRRREIDRT